MRSDGSGGTNSIGEAMKAVIEFRQIDSWRWVSFDGKYVIICICGEWSWYLTRETDAAKVEIASGWKQMEMSRDCREYVHAVASRMDQDLQSAITQVENSNVG